MFMQKSLRLTAIICCLATATVYSQSDSDKETKLEDFNIDEISEAFGHFIGRNLNPPGLKFNVDLVVKGIRGGAEGKPAPMTDQEYEEAMGKLQILAFQKLSEKNLADADKFLKENASKSGIIEIEPGKLQYSIIESGAGPVVEEHFTPSVNYKGSYIDGTVFGSSEETGGPTEISLDQTIPGFNKGLVGMREGEKRKLFIHPDLGYGTSGQLQPNSLLIFDIEIIKSDSSADEDNATEETK